MRVEVTEELKADGFSVLSEFAREPPTNLESEPDAPATGEDVDGLGKSSDRRQNGRTRIWKSHIWETGPYILIIG